MTRSVFRLAAVGMTAALLALPARAQTTYTWTNAGANWSATSNWSPAGPPTAGSIARFIPGGAIAGSTVNGPLLDVAPSLLSLTVAPNQNLGGWDFTGANAITIGGVSSTGLTTYGLATYTFNGPTLVGNSGGNTLAFNVGNASTLVLAGNSAVTANQGNINVNGGTFRLDNSGTNINARVLNAGTINVTSGGTFELVGNAAGTSTSVGTLNVNTNNIGGVNSFVVTPNGAATTLTFANSTAGFNSRPGTRGVYRYAASAGNLGDASGGKITFTGAGAPFIGASGLLATSAGGNTVGFAIASDAGGTDFATWSAGSGITRAGATITPTTAAALQLATAGDRAFYNPTASDTATGAITTGSLRITPSADSQSLSLASFQLSTNAVMLNVPTANNNWTFNLTATTGSQNPSATRYYYVNNPTSTLATNLVVAAGTNAAVFAGPGFVDLTGTASQNTLSTTNRFVVAGGVVRGNNAQIGFTSGGSGVISLSGGVIEIKNGANGTGTSADFTRALGASAGNVTWGAGTANEMGSGGFSAFGGAASVNVGGSASPATLQWNSTNFVADGFALKFGSTKSNAQLNWLNPVQLDNGTAYSLREFNVTKGVGGDQTNMLGLLAGAVNADLMKTGNGTLALALAAGNSYAGNTHIVEGLLLVSNTSGSATGIGNVVVGTSGILGGNGFVVPGVTNGVAVFGTVAPGNSVGTLTLGSAGTPTTVNVFNGHYAFELSTAGATAGFNTGGSSTLGVHDLLTINGALNITGNFVIDVTSLGSTGFDNHQAYSWLIATASGGITGTAAMGISAGADFQGMTFIPSVQGNSLYLNFSPVPEPATVLGICGAASGLGYWNRKRRQRKTLQGDDRPCRLGGL